jgi:translation initiation factor 4A
MSFDDLNINEDILRGVYAYGFEKPSAIQTQAIPEICNKKDVIAQAQSGTGKTGAFVIGSLCNIDRELNKTQVLIILPTHELVNQVYSVITEISNYTDITTVKVIGGTNIRESSKELESNPKVIIGTPGRVLDMINRRFLITESLKMLIFDEADEILSKGFKDNIYNSVRMSPENTQICLFSATLPDDIFELTTKFMNNPEKILVKNEELTLEGIQQYFVAVKNTEWKYDIITDLYDAISVNQCIIYINNKSKILEVYDRLSRDNFPVSYITGDRPTEERKEIMSQFRSGSIRILISSDLLSRGIDIQQLSLVINFDIPRDKETYIHRIGRSGRYGRKGVAINLVHESELQNLQHIESFYNTKINEMPTNISELIN